MDITKTFFEIWNAFAAPAFDRWWHLLLFGGSAALTIAILRVRPSEVRLASVGKIWKAYEPALRGHWRLFALLSVCMILTVVTKYAHPFAFRHIVETLEAKRDTGWLVWIYGTVLTMHVTTWAVFDVLVTMYATACMRDAERNTLAMLLKKSARFYGDRFTGSLVTSAKRFRHTLEFVTDQYAFQFGRILTMIVLTTALFFSMRPAIGWIFVSWIMVYLAANYRFALYRMGLEKKAADADSETNGLLADTLSNHHAVRTFAREGEEKAHFAEVTHERMRVQRWADNVGGIVNRLQGLLVVALELLVLSVLIDEWSFDKIKWPEFVFYHAYLTMVIIQLWEVAGAMNKTFKHLGDAEEMADMYAEPPEVRDAAGAMPLRVHEGKIEFHSVDFSYGDGNGAMAVSNFSLTIEPGETVAIVGPSGAGKSTLVNLFQRLYDVNSGYIRIDGQDIANVTQVSLHQHVAPVPQDPNMFHRTIMDNILVGRPDATREEVIAAAKQANAWKFICELRSGLDTIVGERGVKLSGGQRQRIALARAFLGDRHFLVLDEATSALDSATEADIQEAIAELLKNKTSIVIAHRLSTVMKATRIVVMDKGRIVEIGTHKELLAKKGLYHSLWQHQSGGYLAV